MKKLVLYLALVGFMFAIENANAQRIINVISPNEVSPGQTIKVTVEYNISKSRDILVNVQENGGEWKSYAWERVKVKPSKTKVTIEVPVSSEIPLATNAYKIGVALAPVGGSYPDRLDERSNTNVDAVSSNSPVDVKAAALDDIISLTAPEQVSPGEKIKVTVEYEASEPRDILINLTLNKEPWTNYASTKLKVPAGSGTKDIELTVSKDIPLATDAYNLAVAIVPVGENWKSRLDNIIEDKLDAAAATAGKKEKKKKGKK
ncbi:hypothetical protein [Carboxylicivirga sp. M1479]|uniref:hypothetical protein n=1 Tax=Carboxylicivirga sp. M1479 TaxID=2594476 RepID=UPI001177F6B0|nr:hypothetical protein [Carboxylicivirga sp. M1479]TRX70381.1 hypothetical protein FNN09_11685 [Carboxylicivirga sp. M1479]